MKTKKIAALSLLIVNVLLGAWLALLLAGRQAAPQAAVTAPEAVIHTVTDFSVADVAAIMIKNQSTSYAIMQNGTQVEMLASVPGNYDPGQMRALVYAVSSITSSRKIEDESTFTQYGFSSPRAQVTIYLADGSAEVLSVLEDNPLDASCYLYSQAHNAVYLVSSSVTDLFLRSEQDFLSHTVFSLRSADDLPNLSRVTLYPKNGRTYTLSSTDQGYYITAPIRHRLAADQVYTNVYVNLVTLYADEVVASNASLSDYGLDKPDLEVQITMGDKTERAVFVLSENDTALMAQKGGSTVYRLADTPVLMLMQDYTALLGGSIVSYGAGDIAEMTIEQGGRSATLTFTGSSTELIVKNGDKTLDRESVSSVLQAVNQLLPYAELTGSVQGETELTMTMLLRSGTQERIELMDIGQGLYAVSVNGEINFATGAESFNQLSALLDTL